MSSPYDPLVGHLVAVHRALEALFGRCQHLVDAGDLPGEALVAGLHDAARLLRAHHVFEDTMLLPKLRTIGAEGPWSEVAEEHAAMDAALAVLERATPATDRAQLREAVVPLADALPDHFAKEEDHLTEANWRVWMPDEDGVRAFGKAIARVNREALEPSARLLPLLVYNMDEATRARFTDRMPRFVVDGLVPYAFRPAWRSRRPFMTQAPRSWTGWLRGR